jgi:N-carbamoyl-L-amino-acid hydrolase
MSDGPAVDAGRLLKSMSDFAAIGATPAGGVNRQALTVEDRAARRMLAERALARGFVVFQDEAANLFIRRGGRDNTLPPLLMGSHLDSQPTGGRFDGALGTLSAFEVLEALTDAGMETERAIEVVAFSNEEGSRFSPGCMGSMAFSRAASVADWQSVRGTDDALLANELRETLEALPEAEIRPAGHSVSAFVELHIEQGPILERENIPIGVVTGVQGTKWLEVAFSGEAAHAGTTPLEFRKDPMAAAAVAIARIQDGIMPADPEARLTVGRISAEPGSVNVIPGRVSFTIDMRHPDAAALAAIEHRVNEDCLAAAKRWGCEATIALQVDMPPGRFAPAVTAAIADSCKSLAIPSRTLVSGAFHDALFVNRVAPSAMIFVPCRNGVSHNEAEFVSDEHIVTGARVLLSVALRLSGG